MTNATTEAKKRRGGRPRRDMAPKACAVCSRAFGRREGERVREYAKRRACSPECSRALRSANVRAYHASRRALPDPKPCAYCGELFGPAEGEPAWRFRRRRTCSLSCSRRLAAREAAKCRVSTSERALRLLSDYAGVPLTAEDVAEELGLKLTTVRPELAALARSGRVRRWRDPTHDPQEGPAPYLYAVPAARAA